MKHYLLNILLFSIIFLALFGLVEVLDISFLKDPAYLKEQKGIMAAFISLCLLSLDIILPIPGSIVMVGNGALFGIALGTTISVIGGTISTCTGYIIGRQLKTKQQKKESSELRSKANELLHKYEYIALILSRPIPLISESIAIVAGMNGQISFRKTILFSIIGYLPGALIYALVGVKATDINSANYSFLFVICCTGIIWLIGFILEKQKSNKLKNGSEYVKN